METLQGLLSGSAGRWGDRIAVEESADTAITYRELEALSRQVRDALLASGVRRGDRVGVVLSKSIDAVAAIFGILEAGAAYVPVDPTAPVTRAATILRDSDARVAFVEPAIADGLREAIGDVANPPRLVLRVDAASGGLARSLNDIGSADAASPPSAESVGPDELAYILYTSGSTGTPKGVMLTHGNGSTFVDWASATFDVSEQDVFSSHAPFHFDLSIFDLYVSLRHGARLVLIGGEQGKEPVGLADVIAGRGITVWYSTPSILTLLLQYGKLDRHTFPSLRYVLFAGEVFPVKHLRDFRTAVPGPRYFNLYGPTETNVCTFCEIPREIPADRTEPYPIGHACGSFAMRVVGADGEDVPDGEEGELWAAGPGVMAGYWNRDDLTARVMVPDANGRRWYRTGDIVVRGAADGYTFRERRDRMVKRRGFRIELGEVETALYGHPALAEVAAVAVPDERSGVRIMAFLCAESGPAPSVLELKRFSASVLPVYMVPDQFVVCEALPKTSTDKIDYQRLMEMA